MTDQLDEYEFEVADFGPARVVFADGMRPEDMAAGGTFWFRAVVVKGNGEVWQVANMKAKVPPFPSADELDTRLNTACFVFMHINPKHHGKEKRWIISVHPESSFKVVGGKVVVA